MARKDDFGDRMKRFEAVEAGRTLMPLLPVMARIDGRCFSRFTRGMDRPYDKRLSDLMVATTEYLCRETNACMGYTQSDEISLTWLQERYDSEMFFGGKIQKMTSVLASLATGYFNHQFPAYFGQPHFKMACFDCRVWNVPNTIEGANVFLWREQDATRNSIESAVRTLYSHKEVFEKSCSEMQEMMFQKGLNWNDYPAFFKRGTFIQRRTVRRRFSADELEKLPPKHDARQNPNLEIERTDYVTLNMPPFGRVRNRSDVIYRGDKPETADDAI